MPWGHWGNSRQPKRVLERTDLNALKKILREVMPVTPENQFVQPDDSKADIEFDSSSESEHEPAEVDKQRVIEYLRRTFPTLKQITLNGELIDISSVEPSKKSESQNETSEANPEQTSEPKPEQTSEANPEQPKENEAQVTSEDCAGKRRRIARGA